MNNFRNSVFAVIVSPAQNPMTGAFEIFTSQPTFDIAIKILKFFVKRKIMLTFFTKE